MQRDGGNGLHGEKGRKVVLDRLKVECLRLKETISPKCLRVCLAFGHTRFNVRSIKSAQVLPDYLLCFLLDT